MPRRLLRHLRVSLAQRKYNRPHPEQWVQPEADHVMRQRAAALDGLRHLQRGSGRSTLQPGPPLSEPTQPTAALVPQEHAIVYGTIQAYTVDAVPRLQIQLLRSQREHFMLATKLVRGAYMVQERARAAELGYKDPIHRECNWQRRRPFGCTVQHA